VDGAVSSCFMELVSEEARDGVPGREMDRTEEVRRTAFPMRERSDLFMMGCGDCEYWEVVSTPERWVRGKSVEGAVRYGVKPGRRRII
jgi:hypothetical protein